MCCAHGFEDPVIEHFYDVMKSKGVDEASRMSAIAFAQVDPQGYHAVAKIIGEIDAGRHRGVYHWSSWFANKIKDARHALNPEGAEKYGGKGRSKSSPADRRNYV